MTAKPTIETMLAVWLEDYEEGEWAPVEDVTKGTWRHGSTHSFIACRLSDGTNWRVRYRDNPSGDYNDFRDGDLSDSDVVQVWPQQITTITYTTTEPPKT